MTSCSSVLTLRLLHRTHRKPYGPHACSTNEHHTRKTHQLSSHSLLPQDSFANANPARKLQGLLCKKNTAAVVTEPKRKKLTARQTHRRWGARQGRATVLKRSKTRVLLDTERRGVKTREGWMVFAQAPSKMQRTTEKGERICAQVVAQMAHY